MTDPDEHCRGCGKNLGPRTPPWWAFCRRCGRLNEEPEGIRALTIAHRTPRLALTE